jgi:hypothetical protein
MNPKIFSPDWFARHQLISGEQAEKAEVQIIHRNVTQFNVDWLSVIVDAQRFQVTTTEAPYVRLHDLVVRTFKELLPHTPITMLGINRDVHLNLGKQEIRDRIGHILAPPEAWGEWAPKIKSGVGEKHGGMVSLTMQQRDVDDRPKGHIQATVQPSMKIKGMTGIYVAVNDHYELEDSEKKKAQGGETIINLLLKNYELSLRRSDWIIDQVLRLKDF